jgi:hypothetical protein
MKTIAPLALALAALGAGSCGSKQDRDVAGWSAQLVSFRISSYSSYPQPSSSTLSIGADGTISDTSTGTTATMSDADRTTFTAWAASQELVGALQDASCSQVADGGYTLVLEIQPGVFLGENTNHAGCRTGPIEAVVELAFSLQSKYLAGGSGAPLSGAPVIEHPEVAGHVSWANLTVQSIDLERTGLACGSTDICGGLGPDDQIFRVTNGINQSGLLPDTDAARLRQQAASPDLLAAWPGTCASEDDSASFLSIDLSSSITLTTGTDGCANGPITQLVANLGSVIESLPPATP